MLKLKILPYLRTKTEPLFPMKDACNVTQKSTLPSDFVNLHYHTNVGYSLIKGVTVILNAGTHKINLISQPVLELCVKPLDPSQSTTTSQPLHRSITPS